MTGSIDHSVIVWDASEAFQAEVKRPRPLLKLEHHQHYVQGVAWDPLGCATLVTTLKKLCVHTVARKVSCTVPSSRLLHPQAIPGYSIC